PAARTPVNSEQAGRADPAARILGPATHHDLAEPCPRSVRSRADEPAAGRASDAAAADSFGHRTRASQSIDRPRRAIRGRAPGGPSGRARALNFRHRSMITGGTGCATGRGGGGTYSGIVHDPPGTFHTTAAPSPPAVSTVWRSAAKSTVNTT